MTNEQWLVYLWSIYPNGEFIQLWILALILFAGFLMILAIIHFDKYQNKITLWTILGKWKIIIPSILVLFIFLSNLVPKRDHFILIMATPYAVEAGKSIVDSLNDPNSKLYKLNKMTDKALDKALMYLGENENDKQNKNEKE